MLGAIIGDIAGAPYEFTTIKVKEFEPFLHPNSGITDDSIMTTAIADCLLNERQPAEAMRDWARRIKTAPHLGGYGQKFIFWLSAKEVRPPYNSYGNGAAMRISPAGWLYGSLGKSLEVARIVTEVTHNHPEGVKGAQAVVMAIFLARTGTAPDDIAAEVANRYGYDLARSVGECRATHVRNETCPGTVPDALICALAAKNFEDAIRNAVSLGGDADTLGAIAGSVAEALFGIPSALRMQAMEYLPEQMIAVVDQFYGRVRRSVE
ncbi:MAG: ADP-ribosylglycohydrolase family protein [Halieaceae bacterium]|jgi:ADP-ribosylglycohydrolase|nr:ADP-ribosylglycohydrolase family protein [Halieaceae bacterium]